MKITYEIIEKTVVYEAAWGCHAQCCIRANTGSRGWYIVS